MNNQTMSIDLLKLMKYVLKRAWLMVLCAAIGFSYMYWNMQRNKVDTYSASATMYVYNGNPNVINYQYTSVSDLNSAVALLDTYLVVVKSNKVMDTVTERLCATYPTITSDYIRATLTMGSVSETGVLKVTCTTRDAQMAADICNAVVDVAPSEIIRVVSAGSIQVIDYAEVPQYPNARSGIKQCIVGALAGAVLAGGLLLILFLLNRRITESREIENNYTPPLLACINREKGKETDSHLLDSGSTLEKQESYAKLRMNLMYTLMDKGSNVIMFTSAVSGEGKSTISANLGVSCSMSGKRVLLIDGDMRRGCQSDIFGYSAKDKGLSNVLMCECQWQDAVKSTSFDGLDVMPAGYLPPNPAELLGSAAMKSLLENLKAAYDIILVDAPPVNIVSDPLALSSECAGCVFVIRQNFTDHREVRRALIAAEMTGMNVLGFAFYGENAVQTGYYYRNKYKKYYKKYDNRLSENDIKRDRHD